MQLEQNRFTSYTLTEEEELRGSVFNMEQIWFLQNKMAEAALAKNALKLDPNDQLPYIQQESFLAGQIEFIEWMLANSEEAETQLTALYAGTTDEEINP